MYSLSNIITFLFLAQKFPDDQTTSINIQEVAITAHSDQMSHEDCSSDILRHHYSTLTSGGPNVIKLCKQLNEYIGVSHYLYNIN